MAVAAHHSPPVVSRRVELVVLGALLGVPGALFLVPTLASVVVETSVALPLRLLNALLFGTPAALVLVAGVSIALKGAGMAPGVTVGPSTVTGRWAAGLAAAALGFLVFATVTVAITQPQVERFFDALWAALPLLAAWLCGAVSFLLGAVALTLRRERSMVVLAVTAIGFVITAFGVGEALFPH